MSNYYDDYEYNGIEQYISVEKPINSNVQQTSNSFGIVSALPLSFLGFRIVSLKVFSAMKKFFKWFIGLFIEIEE